MLLGLCLNVSLVEKLFQHGHVSCWACLGAELHMSEDADICADISKVDKEGICRCC